MRKTRKIKTMKQFKNFLQNYDLRWDGFIFYKTNYIEKIKLFIKTISLEDKPLFASEIESKYNVKFKLFKECE